MHLNGIDLRVSYCIINLEVKHKKAAIRKVKFMKKFTYTITDAQGIHARPAGMLVKEASKYKCSITIDKSSNPADAKRIFSVMSLAAKKGDSGTLTFDGIDEEPAWKAIKDFFSKNI